MKVKYKKVEDICSFIGGSQPPKSSFIYEPREGYIQLIQTRDYKSDAFPTYIPIDSTKKFCDKKDIMVGRYGPPVFQILHGLEGAYNVALMKAVPKKEVDRDFLYYFLKQDSVFRYVDQLSARTGGQTGVDLLSLNQYPVRIPEKIEDQKLLVGSLKAIDGKIEVNNRINAELKAMTKTLYDYWFVQFDFPDVDGNPYKTSGGKMVYSDVLKREIPDGWEVSTLANWVQSDKTGDWGQESEEGNYTLQVYCIRGTDTNDISNNGSIGAPKRFILPKNDHKLLSPFDFVIEISGGSTNQSTGRMATITNEVLERFDHPLICSNFCKAISLVDNDYFYNFGYLWQRLYDNGVLFGWEGKTSGIKNLLFDSFISNHSLPMPPKELAKKFFDFADRAHKKNQTLLKENKHLEDLRDWLLPMLMNGQVTVSQ